MFHILEGFKVISRFFPNRLHDAKLFGEYFLFYIKKKLTKTFLWFEKNKNILVKFLLMKRGRYNRPFLHIATMGIIIIGVLVGPFIADTYPILSGKASAVNQLPSPSSSTQSIIADNNIFQTNISQKPRDQIIDYTVERGDTISTIADKFGISQDTIRWENNLSNDDLSVGDMLRILPVTGIAYKVQKGDTIYTIAKHFGVDAEKIVNWPFNEFANPETFSLVAGEILIVPDGVIPSEHATPTEQQSYVSQIQPGSVVSSGGYYWPSNGLVTQYPVWYHMALDIAAPIGSPIVATKNGKVLRVEVGGWNYGYGTNVVVDHGDGITSLYAHMSAVAVSVGQDVIGGKTIVGYIGVTGHTTGPHVHFEIRKNNVTVNPLPYVQ